jgi:hypothetical protein
MATCWECGAGPPLHDHHVVPRSRGGTKTVPLCEPCHGKVHDKDMVISAMIREAHARIRKHGGVPPGSPPLGYKKTSGTLTIDPAERALLFRMHQLRASGLSIRKITAALNDEGFRSRTGGPIHSTTIARALRTEPEQLSIPL